MFVNGFACVNLVTLKCFCACCPRLLIDLAVTVNRDEKEIYTCIQTPQKILCFFCE